MLKGNTWNHLTVCWQMINIFNCVQTNNWYQIELLILSDNTWNHLTVQINEL